ncbi:MAG: 2-amino-4-hydroxy-6-hydroxymethyldihydropteridine diphosphokinase [Gemmatimonadota bacterium]
MVRSLARVAISLGSNVENREASLRLGAAGLARLHRASRCSRVYETQPMHVTDQPAFLNACCTGWTDLTPVELLAALKKLERHAGRLPGGRRYGPRPLDLDLLLHGDQVIDEPGLIVPHARLRERAFVLVPLAELAADWVVPASRGAPSATVRELAAAAGTRGVVATTLDLQCCS